MKPYLFNKGWKAVALISLSVALVSCQGMGDKMPIPERKKMPRFTNSGIQQSSEYLGSEKYTACGMMFETDYVTLAESENSNSGNFIRIPLADANMDEAAFNIINMFKPFASIYLSQWAKLQSKGVIIDLRSARQLGGSREDYRLEQDDISVPVILYWDAASAIRAQNFRVTLNTLPGINSKKITQQSIDY